MPPSNQYDPAAARLYRECILDTETLFNNPGLIDAYPHGYVFLRLNLRFTTAVRLPELFGAVEQMEARGWKPMSWVFDPNSIPRGVVMRRRTPAA